MGDIADLQSACRASEHGEWTHTWNGVAIAFAKSEVDVYVQKFTYQSMVK